MAENANWLMVMGMLWWILATQYDQPAKGVCLA